MIQIIIAISDNVPGTDTRCISQIRTIIINCADYSTFLCTIIASESVILNEFNNKLISILIDINYVVFF